MDKAPRKHLLVMLILLQLVIAITAGLLVLETANGDKAATNTYVDKIDVGNLDNGKAIQRVRKYFDGILKDGAINIVYEDGQYSIGYREIDAGIDYDATMKIVRGESSGDSFINLINGYFISKSRRISPVITFNEEKLRKKLEEFADKVKREPVNANIYLRNGKVIKSPDVSGRKLNIDNAVEKLRKDLNENFGEPIIFGFADNPVMATIPPEITLKDLEGINDIIAEFSTDIKSFENEDSMKLAAYAVNKVLVCPADPGTGKKAGVFSFNKYLGAENGIQNQNNEGYNQVVSTLYAALLNAGVKEKDIERTPNDTHVDYIDPKYSCKILGNITDFKFTNTSDSAVIVFAEVKDSKVKVTIVGKKNK